MRNAPAIVTTAYQMACVRGMLSSPEPSPEAAPQLPRRGLAGMPVDHLCIPPACKALLAKHHILSVETLCQLRREDLQHYFEFPPAYAATIDKKLGALGLRLGMTQQACENFSRAPSEPVRTAFPAFQQKRPDAEPGPAARKASPIMASVAPASTTVLREAPTQEKNPDQFADYPKFKFGQAPQVERFIKRANFLFAGIINANPATLAQCSSHSEELTHLLVRQPTYTKENGDKVYPVAMAPSMLRVLATYAPDYPEIFSRLVLSEECKRPAPRRNHGQETTAAVGGRF